MSMKLSKLPDRTPVKLTTTLMPNLAARLRDYADFYAETYGTREEVADLVPFMLEAFLMAMRISGGPVAQAASRTL
jgi:hypothetical protein